MQLQLPIIFVLLSYLYKNEENQYHPIVEQFEQGKRTQSKHVMSKLQYFQS
jgi:hypothetical protein